jgi:hypothetical protein
MTLLGYCCNLLHNRREKYSELQRHLKEMGKISAAFVCFWNKPLKGIVIALK